jgi:hypothetical protein
MVNKKNYDTSAGMARRASSTSSVNQWSRGLSYRGPGADATHGETVVYSGYVDPTAYSRPRVRKAGIRSKGRGSNKYGGGCQQFAVDVAVVEWLDVNEVDYTNLANFRNHRCRCHYVYCIPY